MTKLNQIIAVEKSVKGKTASDTTTAYHILQKNDLLQGVSRNYRPRDEDGEQFPPESKRVQTRIPQVLQTVQTALTNLFDLTATKDWANGHARGTVVVDGKVLVKEAPVSFLLFLEKQLTDLHTIVSKLPTLDPAESWHFDDAQNCYASDPAQTAKTKKVPRNHVKAAATDKHPAQVELYHEDVVVGYWTTVKFSGALPASMVALLVSRVEKLQQAVKYAREEANNTEIAQQRVGEALLNFVFQG